MRSSWRLWSLVGLLTVLTAVPLFALEPQQQTKYQCEVYLSGTGQVCTYCYFETSDGGSGQWIVCE